MFEVVEVHGSIVGQRTDPSEGCHGVGTSDDNESQGSRAQDRTVVGSFQVLGRSKLIAKLAGWK
jgi:hypothetical protein